MVFIFKTRSQYSKGINSYSPHAPVFHTVFGVIPIERFVYSI